MIPNIEALGAMTTDTPSSMDHGCAEQFFERGYTALREQPPMKWMTRLFLKISDGWQPKLVDLPTGAGKTDVAVIWVLVLGWYGLRRATVLPVPRRLVWVVNRRVLVQQVFRLADRLQEKLASDHEDESLVNLRAGLANLTGTTGGFFRVVQLRGQLIDDREWSVAPAVPQLIIGTVDQIGSRLLFRGYSLGKWSRPLQAALLAIDAWVCVDEAHLVPAFVLTLRQSSTLAAKIPQDCPCAVSSIFDHLPFWVTELSATPALPPPPADSIFRLIQDDEQDPQLSDRLLAARTRRVTIQWVAQDRKTEQSIQTAAAALAGKVETVAVFIREAAVANRICAWLERQFKGRVLKITGRLRGYERDRLERNEIFQRFQRVATRTSAAEETTFLVGTAAAEVGLDADAAAIICDFASLPTLLQRLGRLDRRGRISREFLMGQGEAPTMTVLARSEVVDSREAVRRDSVARDTRARMLKLAAALRSEEDYCPARLLVGKHWRDAVAKDTKDNSNGRDGDNTRNDTETSAEEQKPKGIDERSIVTAATWEVLLGRGQEQELMRWEDEGGQSGPATSGAPNSSAAANPPTTWLEHPDARVTGGPVAVPPLTSPLIEHWSGTTKPQSDLLPVHPFLYGILPDEEGTPLVGIAFRLELDALVALSLNEDEDQEEVSNQAVKTQIEEILRLFPPRRAELHFVPLTTARAWFTSPEADALPVAHFDGDEWSTDLDQEGASRIQPGSVLVLPTLAGSNDSVTTLLEDANEIASRDVLDGVSTLRPAYWRRITQIQRGEYRLISSDGASRFVQHADAEDSSQPDGVSLGDPAPGPNWRPRLQCKLKIGAAVFRFEYLKRKKQTQVQFLDDSDSCPGHLTRAQQDAESIAAAMAPDNEFLRSLLIEAAKVHDEGKRNCKWQRAMGNSDCSRPVAKPLIEQPESMRGFRHEWESLLKMRSCSPALPDTLSDLDAQLWCDLWNHLVGSHHGHLRPWISDRGFTPEVGKQQQCALRIQAAERFVRLQHQLGPWRLAFLEGLVKAADVASSQPDDEEDGDERREFM